MDISNMTREDAMAIAIDQNESLSPREKVFHYFVLSNPDLRLFDLEPSRSFGSDIHGRLRKLFDGDNVPTFETFEALSYTWGAEWSTRNVIINGEARPVKKNLEAFLRQRREAETAVTLWIDALCINQEDEEEKSRQVPKMSSIYVTANAVTVWLGSADDDSDIAMKVLRELGSGSPYDKMTTLDRREIDALNRLLNRPWWNRVWVIQEIVMGGMFQMQKVRVQCGKEHLEWPRLVIAAARMRSYQYERRQYFPSISHILDIDKLRQNGRKILYGVFSSDTEVTSPSAPHWPLELVSQYRRLQATDSRDKVYALVNMFAPSPRSVIKPNYSTPFEEVYTAFSTWSLHNAHGLEILKHCGDSNHSLPSWVPDWSTDLNCSPLPSGKGKHLEDVPWWSKPIRIKEEGVSSNERRTFQYNCNTLGDKVFTDADRETKIRLKRQEIERIGFGRIEDLDEIPESFSAREMPEEMREIMEELLKRPGFVYCVADGPEPDDNPVGFGRGAEDMMAHTEKLVGREMRKRLAAELQPKTYKAAGLTTASVDIQGETMISQGILWDAIDEIHDGFVSEVAADFENTTKFMVAVGQCKALAEDSNPATRRYPDLKERLKAFWLTLGGTRTQDR